MKYIRTENGHIYAYVKQRIFPSQYKKFGLYRHNLNRDYEQIIAQADTIEELCDEFVLVDETLPPHLDTDLKEIKMYKTYISGSRGIIYGAIWTSKGLIYVAKMNENGEMELV